MVELSWHDRLDGAGIVEVTGLLQAVTRADGIAPVSEAVLLRLGGLGGSAHLLARKGSQLVGYANLEWATDRVSGELAVHPEHRKQRIGTKIVQALLERVATENLWLWAHGEHPAAVKLAERFGFSRARVLLRMARSLRTPLDPPVLPAGVRLRPFVVGADEERFVEVNNRAFEWHPEQGGWNVEQVLIREAEPWFDPVGFLLAVDENDRLLGFHWTKIHDENTGEVYVLGVDPSAHGRRLGVALTLAGLQHLRNKGLSKVILYVEADNEPAVTLYRKLGFDSWGTDVAYSRKVRSGYAS